MLALRVYLACVDIHTVWIHDHLKGKSGDVQGCTFSVTNDKKEVCDEIDALIYAVPKSKKRKAADVSETETASCSGAKQMPI